MLEPWLLEILACPRCRGPVTPVGQGPVEGLACAACRVVYPVREGIPVMLADEALPLAAGEPDAPGPPPEPPAKPRA